MSREIKFRAWNTYSLRDGIEKRLLRMIDFKLGDTDEDLIISSMSYIDDETIIRRYIGLNDKNGVEIFEGDIVSDDYWRSVVKWQHGEDDEARAYFSGFWIPREPDELEVIGNIYENPELLEAAHV